MSDVIRMRVQDVIGLPGGGGSDAIWLPSVDEDGDLSWSKSSTSTPPETVNIKGPAGADGADGQNGQDGAPGADGNGIKSIEKTGTSGLVDTYTITFDDDTTETYTVTNGADGQDGTDGQDGADGLGIKSVDIVAGHLIVTYDDNTTHDAGEIGGGGGTERGVAIPTNNKLLLPDGKWKATGNGHTLTITVTNNVIKINGQESSASSYLTYMKLSPIIETYVGSAAKSDWKNESWDGVEVGKSYGLQNFILGGTMSGSGGNDPVAAVRNTTDSTSILSPSKGLVTLDASASYARLFLAYGRTFSNYQIGVYIKENEFPTEWEYLDIDTTKKYYSAVANDNTSLVTISSGRTPNYTQGMCADDDYIYTCAITSTDSDDTFVAKYDKSTGALVTSTTTYSLGHCNSMTVKDGVIYCIALDNAGTVHKISASDLSYIGAITVDLSGVYANYTGIGAIFYDEDKSEFVALIRGTKKGYAFFDNSFVFKNIVWTDTIEGTYGSFTVKNGFIYQNIYGTTSNKIAVITRNGTYIDDIALNLGSGAEVEDIEFDEWNNYIYINYMVSGNAYVARVVATEMKMVTTS